MLPARVKSFLKKRAKRFNPNDNEGQVDQCAICLENFSETDNKKIA